MQASDTRSPTALRPYSDVEPPADNLFKAIALAFGLMMLATMLAFGLTPFASAATALVVLVFLTAVSACAQPIIRWVASHRN